MVSTTAPKISPEQVGLMPDRSCGDQDLSPTTFIVKGLQKKLKTTVAVIDLTFAYEMVPGRYFIKLEKPNVK